MPVRFEQSPTPQLFQTDAFEFGDNRAFKTFQGMDISNDTILTTQEDYAWDGFSRADNAAQDVDFDFTINTPLALEGDAILTFTFSVLKLGSSSTSVPYKITANLIRFDGTTETVLATRNFADATTLNTGEGFHRIVSFKLPVAKTKFNPGDIVRLNIVFDDITQGGQNLATFIYHDPKNRTFDTGTGGGGGNTTTSKMELTLPINTNYI